LLDNYSYKTEKEQRYQCIIYYILFIGYVALHNLHYLGF